jgi:hypothetical protein
VNDAREGTGRALVVAGERGVRSAEGQELTARFTTSHRCARREKPGPHGVNIKIVQQTRRLPTYR